ncbi:MAG: tetratricopeptide repeat protein [Edafosvirus sp.]|uniref:Tetratricopeptide repeat protein n=1 Tax=Edafosvirus sp. TaxID=2487765 RepID=A0A3G4ZSJ9_9VIRU|nr:MAG: tetratricopeptide repeat protein [Edafosvirus sp.]
MDWNKYITGFVDKANNGDVESMNKLHVLYYYETHLLQNFNDKLIEFYQSGADKPYSSYQLALFELNGLNDKPINFEKGIELLKKSMELGCSQAFVYMAMLKANKMTDYGNYNELLETGMKMKNSNAFLLMAEDTTSKKKKVEYYKRAIDLGHTGTYYYLGQFYHDNDELKLAKKYYLLGTKANDKHCYFNLGVMMREGEFFEKDTDKAIKLFQDSFELGNVKAATCIGSIYQDEDDMENAEKYYKLAIDKDEMVACHNLGNIYNDDKKYKEAIKLYIKGALLGHLECMKKLSLFGVNVTSSEEDIDKVIAMRELFKGFGCMDEY